MKNREGYEVTETERECTNCHKMFEKTSKMTLCPSCNSSRVKEESQEIRMYRRAKSRAKERNIEFNLEKCDITIPTHCPILGIKLKAHEGRSGGNPESPALDRKDPSKGYTKDNVWVISHRANMMKSNASEKELIRFAKWILHDTGSD